VSFTVTLKRNDLEGIGLEEGDLVFIYEMKTFGRVKVNRDTGRLGIIIEPRGKDAVQVGKKYGDFYIPVFIEVAGLTITVIRGLIDLWPVFREIIRIIKNR